MVIRTLKERSGDGDGNLLLRGFGGLEVPVIRAVRPITSLGSDTPRKKPRHMS